MSVVGLLVVLAVGCGGGDAATTSIVVPVRVPDVEGVVTAAGPDGIVIDGGRAYELTADAASVSTYTLEPVPVRPGTYVHVGLDDEDRVEWVATIGIVVKVEPPIVRYAGRLVRVTEGRALFEDGTALRIPSDLTPAPGFHAVVVDPATGRIALVVS